MAPYYVDTSALIKAYVREAGHDWMKGLCRPSAGNAIFISQLTLVGMEVALVRKGMERALSTTDRA